MFNGKSNKFHFEPNLIKSNVWKWKIAETIVVVWTCKTICEVIPFVPAVGTIIKLMSCACFGISTIRGIGEMSVMQRLILEIKYVKNKRKLHLKSPDYIRKEKANGFNREDKSIVEIVLEKLTEKTSVFAEKFTGESEEEY